MDDFMFPPKVRKVIYVLVVLGTAVVVPLDQLDKIPDFVSAVWTSLAAAASLLARFNVSSK